MSAAAQAWLRLVAVAAITVGGCDAGEPRALRLRVALDPTVPAFDSVLLGVASLRDGVDLEEEQFVLRPADFDAAGSYETVLFIAPAAELVEAQADVRAGTATIGHGRRSVTTFAGRSYELEVNVQPTPRF